jgi:hypothetical protein
MYLDSDAYVTNASISIDAYLSRARRMGDEGVAAGSGRWEVCATPVCERSARAERMSGAHRGAPRRSAERSAELSAERSAP